MSTKSKAKVRKHEMSKSRAWRFDTDGESYWVAPRIRAELEEILSEFNAARMVAETLTNHLNAVWVAIEKRKLRWWDQVYEELSLSRAVRYQVDIIEGRVWPLESPKVDVSAPADKAPGEFEAQP